MKSFFLFSIFSFLSLTLFSQQAVIDPYPLPSIYQDSELFKLNVNGKTVPVTGYNPKYDYAGFAMSEGTAEIIITVPQQIEKWNISPRKLDIKAEANGNQLRFSFQKKSALIIRINNMRELVLNADSTEKDTPASTGSGIFNIVSNKYKAKPGSRKLATSAIQRAIDDAAAFKNGIVYIPAGVYITGNLKLKSYTSLYLEPGAVLLFSGRKKDYAVHAHKTSQHRDITWWIATDSGAKQVRIFGRGILDGNGKYATEKEHFGNHILAVMAAEDFKLDGPLIRNSGAWALIVVRSKNVQLRNFRLFNRFDMGENDGVDVMESEQVLVQNAIGIALDDPFSAKTWKQDTDLCRNWPGSPKPQSDIVFDNLLSWTYCYAYKIGQGVMQPQTNISFTNCVVYDAAVGIGVHHKWGTSFVQDIIFDQIEVERLSYQNDDHRTWCVLFLQNGDKKGSGPVSSIRISNVNVYDAGRSPGKIKGVNEHTQISNVSFLHIRLMQRGNYAATLAEMNIRDTLHCSDVRVIRP